MAKENKEVCSRQEVSAHEDSVQRTDSGIKRCRHMKTMSKKLILDLKMSTHDFKELTHGIELSTHDIEVLTHRDRDQTFEK